MNKNVLIAVFAVICVATALALGPQWLGTSPVDQPAPAAASDAAPALGKCICGDRSADGSNCICRDLGKCAEKCPGVGEKCAAKCQGAGEKCAAQCAEKCQGKCGEQCQGKCGEKCQGQCPGKCCEKCQGTCGDKGQGQCPGKQAGCKRAA